MQFMRCVVGLKLPLSIRRAVSIALCLLASACSDRDNAPLRFGSRVAPGYELFYIARDLGYFHDQPIQFVELRSASQVISALQSGAINAAALTLDEALRVIDAGTDLEIVDVIDVSHGADIPGEIIDVLVARRGEGAARLESITALLTGFYRVHAKMLADPAQTTQLARDRLRLSEREIQQAFQLIDIPSAAQALAMLQKDRLVDRAVTAFGTTLSDAGKISGACECPALLNDAALRALAERAATP